MKRKPTDFEAGSVAWPESDPAPAEVDAENVTAD